MPPAAVTAHVTPFVKALGAWRPQQGATPAPGHLSTYECFLLYRDALAAARCSVRREWHAGQHSLSASLKGSQSRCTG